MAVPTGASMDIFLFVHVMSQTPHYFSGKDHISPRRGVSEAGLKQKAEYERIISHMS
jgi:hypothetical protein